MTEESPVYAINSSNVQTLQATAAKIIDPRPVAIRWQAQADGSKVLQFAQAWREGWNEGGIEWVDVPTVAAAIRAGGEKME